MACQNGQCPCGGGNGGGQALVPFYQPAPKPVAQVQNGRWVQLQQENPLERLLRGILERNGGGVMPPQPEALNVAVFGQGGPRPDFARLDPQATALAMMQLELQRQKQQLEGLVQQGGAIGQFDARLGIGGRVGVGSPFVGGFSLSSIANIPDDALAGTVIPLVFAGDDLARMYGQTLCRAGAYISSVAQTGGNLASEPQKVTVTMTVNGDTDTRFLRVPLDVMFNPFAPGAMSLIPLIGIPSASNIVLTATVNSTLTGTPGQFSALQFKFQTGGSCDVAAANVAPR